MDNIKNTTHKLYFADSRKLDFIQDNSIDLVMTSPPYPMIEMWDEMFFNQNKEIKTQFQNNNGNEMFDLMHNELDKVWKELNRVVKKGGFVVINIGDATRTINNHFQLYSNHSRITEDFINLGFDVLPLILWKKTANTPNKFMGSGMLPSGAYITLEHEYILIFRKGKRDFKTEQEKQNRRESAYFWEERNTWFSDIWELKGVKQDLKNDKTRARSAGYCIDLPYRIINMFSCKGDMVLDPFLGTGTTIFASAIAERNSIGIELDNNFNEIIKNGFDNLRVQGNKIINERLQKHKEFIEKYTKEKQKPKYHNNNLDVDVITNQETMIELNYINNLSFNNNCFQVNYKKIEQHNIDNNNTFDISLKLKQLEKQLFG